MFEKSFWNQRRVFLTGHTGFKGSWLCIWLHSLGAEVTGYALDPPTNPNLFELGRVGKLIRSRISDIRDAESLKRAIRGANPEIVIHMAAQPIVRDSYNDPVKTYAINVMGTLNLFEAVRESKSVRAVINVTTDKCYENREWVWAYRENEAMGGYDPYSNSKACSELVTSSYRNSFFNPKDYARHKVAVASARSGNVIGGGDWAKDRLLPDCVRALLKGEKIFVRSPKAIRPWQHVLDPLSGYLLLSQKLCKNGVRYGEAWNFGPEERDAKPVEWIVRRICVDWGNGAAFEIDKGRHPHEAHYLKLDCSKARSGLHWYPKWNLEQAVDKVMEWVRAYRDGRDMRKVCHQQIQEYERAANGPF
jgi:CDP-glucose 4,6-dehydratase